MGTPREGVLLVWGVEFVDLIPAIPLVTGEGTRPTAICEASFIFFFYTATEKGVPM